MNPSHFMTRSLAMHPWGGKVARVCSAAIQAVDPAAAVHKHMQLTGEGLQVDSMYIDLSEIKRILIAGAGKAGTPMVQAVAEILGERVNEGVVIVKQGYGGAANPGSRIEIIEAGHPTPDERGVHGTSRMLQLLQSANEEDLVISLISGGGSALLTSPEGNISLEELQALTSLLLASGASINEINAVRKHLDRVKGGKLARVATPAHTVTLILSDVIGDPLDVIASGPFVPDPSTFQQAYNVLEKYGIYDRIPGSIKEHLLSGIRGEIPETPKQGDPIFDRVYNVVIGSNREAARAALSQAEDEGMNTCLLTTYLQGEARQAGRFLGTIGRQVADTGQPVPRPACLIAGGETTVTLRGKGAGGRNQELALGAVYELKGLGDVALVALATDGGDGPTDAAGAVVTGDTLARASIAGMDPGEYLRHNDSYHFFEALGDLLKPGPTQTNVNDLAFLFAF